ncbi:MAG: hypothetical protein PHF67_01805 [Candidatus Nanoarchaeia archaeon]|nr:hypothetical protein [Candidatus Nanoarchaeia archaeon]
MPDYNLYEEDTTLDEEVELEEILRQRFGRNLGNLEIVTEVEIAEDLSVLDAFEDSYEPDARQELRDLGYYDPGDPRCCINRKRR